MPHISASQWILSAFVLAALLPALLAEIRPRNRGGGEDEPAREPERTSVSLAEPEQAKVRLLTSSPA